jgi:hypothetical protein
MTEAETDTMPDLIREQLIRLIYKVDELAELYDECTEDEYVTRVFKGRVEGMSFNQNTFYYSFSALWWKLLKVLFDFCEKNGLEMNIHGSKEYETAYLEITKKEIV